MATDDVLELLDLTVNERGLDPVGHALPAFSLCFCVVLACSCSSSKPNKD